MTPLLTGTAVFLVTYVIITSERIHRTIAALGGALVLVVLGILTQHRAFEAVDWNVIFLLAGMMIIANVTEKTGVFQWLAIRSAKIARGNPFYTLALLAGVTAVLSAFLDNVTTVVLIAPVTLYVATILGTKPMPFLIAQILASNIGGTATLIGDPPNIIIGSAADLDFVAFLVNLAPPAMIILLLLLPTMWLFFRKDLQVRSDQRLSIQDLDESKVITNPPLLRKALIVLGFTILGFLLHQVVGLEPATIALIGALVLLAISGVDLHGILKDVEWATLLFFVGLFILVEGVVQVGLVGLMAEWLLALAQGNLQVTTLMILWLSAIASGVIDNIPYTATMVPIVQELGNHMPSRPLWWALALGACLGGNLTLVGASANVVVASISERGGYPIAFRTFLKYGAVVTLESLLVATAYVWLRYLM